MAAIHSVWNWAQGNLFGIAVSGYEIDTTVWKFSAAEQGQLISGGGFGLEGGYVT